MCMKKAAGGGGGKLDRILRERGAKQGGVLIVQPPSHQEFSKKKGPWRRCTGLQFLC